MLSACLVEMFGDIGVIEPRGWVVAEVAVLRDMTLLDLRGSCAMRSGTVAAVCKTGNREASQSWSRHFYQDRTIFDMIDGLIYSNAHNDDDAIALYERARAALRSRRTLPLSDPSVRSIVSATAHANSLDVTPY